MLLLWGRELIRSQWSSGDINGAVLITVSVFSEFGRLSRRDCFWFNKCHQTRHFLLLRYFGYQFPGRTICARAKYQYMQWNYGYYHVIFGASPQYIELRANKTFPRITITERFDDVRI
jgi:hypothetical protein